MTKNRLTSSRVEEIFLDCFFKEGEPTDVRVVVEGITAFYGFHPERLESHKEDVRELLAQLPDEFHAETGGGWSFLNACNNRDGELWTGDHMTMEQLFALGVALELVVCLMPRDTWSILPGGVPYYMVMGEPTTPVDA